MKKYSIVTKQMPINKIHDFQVPVENILFNEEIELNENNTRIRIIIQDFEDIYNVISYQYEKYAGLCGWKLGIYKNEVKNIDDLINKVFILQLFKDRGISIATGILPDIENYVRKENNMENNTTKLKNQEKINIYAKFVFGEKATDNMDEIYGKSKDVISILEENKKYCNSKETEFDKEELKSINNSLGSLIKELKSDYQEEDFVFLFEHPMDGELHIKNSEQVLSDLCFYYLSKIEEETELKDININEFVMCYFDNENIDNLENYGPDTNSLVMPTVGDLYSDILNNIHIKHDSILTDEISDGKYKITINFDDTNSIVLDTRASNTYKETALNVQCIIDKYLELQCNLESNNYAVETELELD